MKNSDYAFEKKIKLIIIVFIIFIIITIFTFAPSIYSYSKFGTTHNVTGKFKIAKWKFNISDGTNNIESINLNDTLNQGYSSVSPGASGVIKIVLNTSDSNGGSEVKLGYNVSLNNILTERPDNLKIYSTSNYSESSSEFTSTRGIIDVGDTSQTVYLYWQWYYYEDNISNENDNLWMNKDVKIALNIDAEQIVGDE